MPIESIGFEPRPIEIAIGDVDLVGDLTLPSSAEGIVIFAGEAGASRLSSRNRFVAHQLAGAGLATLLLDLLTPAEEEEDRRSGEQRFDMDLLAERLGRATEFVRGHSDTHKLLVGYLGASIGAAAALVAAARSPEMISAIVLSGGRPDLAAESIESVSAPTLFIVGGADHPVLELNARAHERLRAEKRIEVITGATHLFEEPGALEEVSRLSREWFVRLLIQRVGARPMLEPPSFPAA